VGNTNFQQKKEKKKREKGRENTVFWALKHHENEDSKTPLPFAGTKE